MRGGADHESDDQEPSLIITRAISNAKEHGISIHAGVKNLANGNCAFESIIDSINTRVSFTEEYDGTPDYWRNIWMTEVESVAYEEWSYGMTRNEWKDGWAVLKGPRTYEHQLGDLVLPGIAHCTKKDILIFNTSPQAHSPIYVVESSLLCGQPANTEIPICLAYDQSHYEPLVPDTEEDIIKTIDLKKAVTEGIYRKKMDDMAFINRELYRENMSYATATKKNTKERISRDIKLKNEVENLLNTTNDKSNNIPENQPCSSKPSRRQRDDNKESDTLHKQPTRKENKTQTPPEKSWQ